MPEIRRNPAAQHRHKHELQTLNASPDLVERESEIVGQAGRLGVVTVATNMAGRGTDILLGGNPSVMARIKVRDELAAELLGEEDLAAVPKVLNGVSEGEGMACVVGAGVDCGGCLVRVYCLEKESTNEHGFVVVASCR